MLPTFSQARLNAILADKANIQRQLAGVDEKLQDIIKTQGQRPRETEQDIDNNIAALERER